MERLVISELDITLAALPKILREDRTWAGTHIQQDNQLVESLHLPFRERFIILHRLTPVPRPDSESLIAAPPHRDGLESAHRVVHGEVEVHYIDRDRPIGDGRSYEFLASQLARPGIEFIFRRRCIVGITLLSESALLAGVTDRMVDSDYPELADEKVSGMLEAFRMRFPLRS